ncbi:50S ribosomal protein P1 [Candidatus Pacearchaeota archaeon]|nr:50S ribosomal protein P1 [Candidatus Pacearchaeota archaeon]|tara:strand:- start:9354 stop:9647 length:294 start_codon:yes stop_codon:yes gene_type:complete
MEYIYGALLLHKLGQPVNEENLKKVISATGVEVDESKVKTMLAALQGVDIDKELEGASAVAAAPASGGAESGEKKEEEAEEEEKPAESAAGLSSLFG